MVEQEPTILGIFEISQIRTQTGIHDK